MSKEMREIDERTNLTANSMFELLLFRLGTAPGTTRREIFGINVFKVREILVMPEITVMVNAPSSVMGIANVRGQMIPVINLAAITGCNPTKGLGILLVTEFARTTQAFAVEDVSEIVRLGWKHVLSAEGNGGSLVTSIARLDGDAENTRLAQVLDVEQILRDVFPQDHQGVNDDSVIPKLQIPPGTVVMAADDSAVARLMIEQGHSLPYVQNWARSVGSFASDGRCCQGRGQNHQRQSGLDADRLGNARDGWLYPDPQH
jgi:two-component system chemotaxis response regulator CheV